MASYDKFLETDLVDLLKKGDNNAFIEIFDRYKKVLYSFAIRRLSNSAEAKDLVHDAFAAIWEKRETINIPGELGAFLYTVIKNRILDHYKHQKVTQKYICHFQYYYDHTSNYCEVDDADHLLRQNDISALIEKEISALPLKMRQVFVLSRKQSMNRKEIADYLGIPEPTVKTNMHRALKILKKKLSYLFLH